MNNDAPCSHPMSYVLRYAYNDTMRGFVPVSEDTAPHYLYKSVSLSRARTSRGRLIWKITTDINQARAWVTREGAERYLVKTFARPEGCSFIVEEVAP